MFLNDAFDREIDARERPERPIPAGEISADAVFVGGLRCSSPAWCSLAAFDDAQASRALVLAGAIVLYDWHHKGNPLRPFVMGLCRALVYVAAAVGRDGDPAQLCSFPRRRLSPMSPGSPMRRAWRALDRIGSFWPLLLLSAPVAVSVGPHGLFAPAIVALAAIAVCAAVAAQLLRRRAAGDVSRAVGLLIAAIALNDALFAARPEPPMRPRLPRLLRPHPPPAALCPRNLKPSETAAAR